MAVLAMGYGVGAPKVNADDLAAQALARELRTDSRESVAVYRRGDNYLIMPQATDHPLGWSCVYVAYAD